MRILTRQAFGVCFIHNIVYHKAEWYHYDDKTFDEFLNQLIESEGAMTADVTCPQCDEDKLFHAKA